MTPDLSELRQRAAEELSGPEAEIRAFEKAFRQEDPRNAELLDRTEQLVDEAEPEPDGWPIPDPDGLAIKAALADDPQLSEVGTELLKRLHAFREKTGFKYPEESYAKVQDDITDNEDTHS